MNEELIARIKHCTDAIRKGVYVSLDVLQDLITDIHDDIVPPVDPRQLSLPEEGTQQ